MDIFIVYLYVDLDAIKSLKKAGGAVYESFTFYDTIWEFLLDRSILIRHVFAIYCHHSPIILYIHDGYLTSWLL